MSVNFGGPPAGGAVYGGGEYAPPRKVNFGWINEAFSLFGAQAGLWIAAVLFVVGIPAVIGGIFGFAVGQQQHTLPAAGSFGGAAFGNILSGGLPPGVSFAIRLFGVVWTAFFYGGIFRMAVKQVRGEFVSFSDLFSGGPTFLTFLGFNIIYGLAVGLGTVLCIVPGLIVAALLLPAYALLADGRGISAALSESSDGMKQDLWNGVGLVLVLGLIVLVSAIPCGLGLFVTYPMLWLIPALAYRDMIGMPTAEGFASNTAPVSPSQGVWPPPPSATQPPPPMFGQTPLNPSDAPNVRRSLSGDDLDNQGDVIPPPGPPPLG